MSEVQDWFQIGHTTHLEDRTGCTVILFDEMAPAAVDVRGGAPGTRETELLQPGRQVSRVNAFVLTGSSIFGLASADGVIRWLAERERGLETRVVPVPIVPAAVVFDLGIGTPRRVTQEDGYLAAEAAFAGNPATGPVGAGTGSTVAKLGGTSSPGGLGIGSAVAGSQTVTAIVVLNALGDVRDPDTGAWLARSEDPSGMGRGARELAIAAVSTPGDAENTTIGAIMISGPASRDALIRCCISAHDALARCIVPAHTLFDGDTFFAAAQHSGETTQTGILALAAATEVAVERAIVGLIGGRAGS